MRRIAALLSLLILGACGGHSRPFYAGHLLETPRITEQRRSPLVTLVYESLANNLVKRIEITTPERRTVLLPEDLSALDMNDLPLPALLGIKHVVAEGRRGVELDFLSRLESGEYVPVTAQSELDGNVRVKVGKPMRSLTARTFTLTPAQLKGLYRVGAIESGTAEWTELELAALQQALSTLAAAELAQLASVRFVRNHQPSGTSTATFADNTWGQYISAGGQRTIYLYDATINYDESKFIGTPDAPLLATAQCLLHEIGHALADPSRTARSSNSMSLLGEAGPTDADPDDSSVLAAYKAVRGKLRGPTPYGATSLSESFAESFALFRADPEALSRVAPRVHEWFLRGGHLTAQQHSE